MKTLMYEAWVAGRCKDYVDPNYCIVALNGEAGEVAEWWKKFQLRGNPGGKLSLNDLKEELGDTLFYLTRLANLFGWSIEDVMDANFQKLVAREAAKEVSANG